MKPETASIVADITSRDRQRVIAAMWAVFRLRDSSELDALAAALPVIEGATAGLELGGMFHSNDATLEFTLGKLRYHRDRRGCLCRLYLDHLLFDPEQEAAAGNVRILQTRYVDRWPEHYDCECTTCNASFAVRHGEQHASWWQWTSTAVQETSNDA